MHLRQLGFTVEAPLMRTEAARLIRELRRHPARALVSHDPATPPSVAPSPPAALTPPRAEFGPPPQTQNPFGEPKRFLPMKPTPKPERVTHPIGATELSESTKSIAHRLRQAAEEAKQKLAANPEGPNVRADAASTVNARLDFWMDACRDVKEMRLGSVHVMELYQNYGCRYLTPTPAQAQELLGALDGALPTWDREHPELFFQTLELNFPHLVRRS